MFNEQMLRDQFFELGIPYRLKERRSTYLVDDYEIEFVELPQVESARFDVFYSGRLVTSCSSFDQLLTFLMMGG